jgi:hypothetical protein
VSQPLVELVEGGDATRDAVVAGVGVTDGLS